MIRHISVFTLLDQPVNGKTKAENVEPSALIWKRSLSSTRP